MERKNFTKNGAKNAVKVLREMFKYDTDIKINVREIGNYISIKLEDGEYLTSTTIGTVSDFAKAYETIGYRIHFGCRAKVVGSGLIVPIIEICLELNK